MFCLNSKFHSWIYIGFYGYLLIRNKNSTNKNYLQTFLNLYLFYRIFSEEFYNSEVTSGYKYVTK
jgi:hypothetical protein